MHRLDKVGVQSPARGIHCRSTLNQKTKVNRVSGVSGVRISQTKSVSLSVSTMQVQDLKDQVGDRATNRDTLPSSIVNSFCRYAMQHPA